MATDVQINVADRCRWRAQQDVARAAIWLEGSKEKDTGSALWVYDVREVIAGLDAARDDLARALRMIEGEAS